MRTEILAGLLAILCVFAALPADAQRRVEGDFELDIRYRATGGDEMPAVALTALREVRNLEVTVERVDGPTWVSKAARLAKGATHTVTIPQDPGREFYRVEIAWAGARRPIELSFSGAVAKPFDLSVRGEDVDLVEGRIGFTATGQVQGVELVLVGERDEVLYQRTIRMDRPGNRPSEFRFDPPTVPVVQARVTAFDDEAFKTVVSFEPVVIEVPHEEVNFAFDSAEITPDQEPKLERTLAEAHKALDKLGTQVRFRLYVAGYTDTVGSHEYNRNLSEARAASIAAWMRAHGIRVSVCSQGFGEEVPAVQTPDETPEPRNRRSLFVLAGQGPTTRSFPRGDWKCR